jgi:hypothetical protein
VGLPEPAKPEVEPYSAKLGIEGVAQPVVGVGVSRFGTSFGGGLALSFTDMLRNHQLVTAFQINSGLGRSTSVKDIGAQVGYFNQAQRWNWGLVGGQVPYLSSGFASTLSRLPNGDLIQTDQLFVFRQTERSASGVVAYPFNRSQRIELQGGASQISFDQIVTTQSFSRLTGAIFEESTETTPIGETLSLGTTSAAYVFDTSVFGATSPVQGQRSRFEVSPTFGSLSFTGALADYRRYFMPARFYTLGVRVMHYGRYGRAGSADVPLEHRLSMARARLRRHRHRCRRVRGDYRERLSGHGSAARQSHADRQRRVPLSTAAAVWRVEQHVWAGPRRGGILRRCRNGVE